MSHFDMVMAMDEFLKVSNSRDRVTRLVEIKILEEKTGFFGQGLGKLSFDSFEAFKLTSVIHEVCRNFMRFSKIV